MVRVKRVRFSLWPSLCAVTSSQASYFSVLLSPGPPRPLLAAPTSRSRQALDTEIKYMGVCILRSYTSCEEEALSSLVHRPGGKIFQACDFFTAMGTKSNY